MKLLAFALAVTLPACLASCSWTKADFQRLGTKVLDTSISTAAIEAERIQVEKHLALVMPPAPSGK